MADFVRRKLTPAQTVGEILQEARKKKDITLEAAEEETKVRAKYLEALEKSDYQTLPETVYAAGFLAKYADFLEVAKEELIEQFKRERGIEKKLSKLAPERKIKEPLFSITPRFLLFAGIALALLIVIGYVVMSVRQFAAPPNLAVSSPSSEQVVTTDKVEIIGKTDEGVTLAINNQTVFINDNGDFRQVVKLNPGLNTFEIRAVNQLKKENVKIIKVLAEFKEEAVEPNQNPDAATNTTNSINSIDGIETNASQNSADSTDSGSKTQTGKTKTPTTDTGI